MVASISKTSVSFAEAEAIVHDAFGAQVTLEEMVQHSEGWFNASFSDDPKRRSTLCFQGRPATSHQSAYLRTQHYGNRSCGAAPRARLRVEVTPVVVLWGGWRDRPAVSMVGGTCVVRGESLAEWARTVPSRSLAAEDRSTVDAACRAFNAADDARLCESPEAMVVQHGPGIVTESVMTK